MPRLDVMKNIVRSDVRFALNRLRYGLMAHIFWTQAIPDMSLHGPPLCDVGQR
jgi:hypothetical protein